MNSDKITKDTFLGVLSTLKSTQSSLEERLTILTSKTKGERASIIDLLASFIGCKSITPADDGAINVLCDELSTMGFACSIMEFGGVGHDPKIRNLVATIGEGKPHICYAGHSDVVPPGDMQSWGGDPFIMRVQGNKIYGRGMVDMKGAIIAFIGALRSLKEDFDKLGHDWHKKLKGRITLLITGDEEGPALDGTAKVLDALASRGEADFDLSIIGEPVSEGKIGDTVKIGARGSVNAELSIGGVQGHVAYDHLASNAAAMMVDILAGFNQIEFDRGDSFFPPTNLEVTGISAPLKACNVIPGFAMSNFNIRYNRSYSSQTLHDIIANLVKERLNDRCTYQLKWDHSSSLFFNEIPENWRSKVEEVLTKINGEPAAFNARGGSSDGKYIKNFCPVMEIGLLSECAHKSDEFSSIEDLARLEEIYKNLLLKILY